MDLSDNELNKILSKTLESPEFNNALGSLTETIKNNLQNIQEETEKKIDDDEEDNVISVLCENLVDILGSYFMDSNGNNICEILQNINENVKKSNETKSQLNETLLKILNQKTQSSK